MHGPSSKMVGRGQVQQHIYRPIALDDFAESLQQLETLYVLLYKL